MNKTVLDHIGQTPIFKIQRLNPNPKVTILAKVEYFNPGGSIKDRPALYMIEDGEQKGLLTKDKTVIEATSGNTGIGLALVCSVKGYRLLLTMSEAVSIERQKILKARGAEIQLTPGHLGTDGAIEEVYNMVRENPDRYFITDQFNNEANWKAHYHGTAQEIWHQVAKTPITLVATMGTTGTLMGVSRKLKELHSENRIIGVEPYLGHKIQGLKNMKEAYVPEIYNKKLLDEKINIEDEEAFEMTRQLASVEGLFVGMSSGAAMAVACQIATRMEQGTIVVIFPDSGERYLSTPLFAVQEKIELNLINSMSHKKESFTPLKPGQVSMYSCGPTANTRMHLGECRRQICADLLSRYLEFKGYQVNHIMNITDLDDKTILGSEENNQDLKQFTEQNIDDFQKDLRTLLVKPANQYPKVSEHVEDMVSLTEKLVDKGVAYEKLKSIYFDISRFNEYGILSGIDLKKIRLGATVDLDEYEKDNPRDFTLLKRSKLSELKRGIYVKSKWGNVRPSWNIQCAAIAMKYLGETIDIHLGGNELAFPHHENELAIAKSITGKPLAKYWLHCERVYKDGKKMDHAESKVTLPQLLDQGYSRREIRLWLLSNHYRKPITYSVQHLENSRKALKRIDTCVNNLLEVKTGEGFGDLDQLLYDIKHGFSEAMDDDLNISKAMAALFKQIKIVNKSILESQISPEGAQKILNVFKIINDVLQVFDFNPHRKSSEIEALIKARDHARSNKDWALADDIRQKLKDKGYTVHDQKLS